MALNRPLHPQPASAIAFWAVVIVLTVLLWHVAGAVLGTLGLLALPFCAANVYLGGGWNDSPLDLVERIGELRRLGWESDQ